MEECYGKDFLAAILDLVGKDKINETTANEIAYKLGGTVGGHFRQNGKHYGRIKFKEMLSHHYETSYLTDEAARREIINILKDPDINQIRLAMKLEKICSDMSTPSEPVPPSVTTQPGTVTTMTMPSKPASTSVTTQPGTASSSSPLNFYGSVQGNVTIQGGSNNQLTVNFELKSIQNIEKRNPEFYEKFIEKLTNEQKQHLETLISPLKNNLAIPKVQTLLESVCLLKTPRGTGTAFLAKIQGIPGVVLLSAGHNMYEELKTGCAYFPDGICKGRDGCQDHGFYSLDYSKFTLFFKNYEGIKTATNDPPQPPQFTLQQLIDKFKNHKISMARRNIMREDRPDKPSPTYTKPNPRNEAEDWFAMVMYNDDDGTTAESKLSKVGLTSLLEVGSSLEQDPGRILFIFGYPGILEGECYPLRFHFGNEKKITGGSDDRIYYDFSTLPGNSGSPILCWQDAEPNFFVKAIHVAGDSNENANKAQRLTNILKELKS